MKHDILEKLQMQLSDLSDFDEPRVLYIFAESRKLIESLNTDKNYETLDFYCDWVLHPSMSRASTKKILEELSIKIDSKNSIEIIAFEKLREELSNFTKKFDLPKSLTSDPDRWFDFRKNLIHILLDCPLKRNDTKIRELSFIKTPGFEDQTGEAFLNYRIKLDDGKEMIRGILLADGGERIKKRRRERLELFAKYLEAKLKFRARFRK